MAKDWYPAAAKLLRDVLGTVLQIEEARKNPHAVLRLCRAHRQIVELHKRDIRQVWSEEADDLVDVPFCPKCAWGGSCSCCADEEDYEWPCEELKILARGLGVLEEEQR